MPVTDMELRFLFLHPPAAKTRLIFIHSEPWIASAIHGLLRMKITRVRMELVRLKMFATANYKYYNIEE